MKRIGPRALGGRGVLALVFTLTVGGAGEASASRRRSSHEIAAAV